LLFLAGCVLLTYAHRNFHFYAISSAVCIVLVLIAASAIRTWRRRRRILTVTLSGIRIPRTPASKTDTYLPWAHISAVELHSLETGLPLTGPKETLVIHLRDPHRRGSRSETFPTTPEPPPENEEIQIATPPAEGFSAVVSAINERTPDSLFVSAQTAESKRVPAAVFSRIFDGLLLLFAVVVIFLAGRYGPLNMGEFIRNIPTLKKKTLTNVGWLFHIHFPVIYSTDPQTYWYFQLQKGHRLLNNRSIPVSERTRRALPHLTAAMKSLERSVPYIPYRITDVRTLFDDMMGAFFEQRREADFLPFARRQLAFYRKRLGPNKMLTGAAHERIGHTLRRMNRYEAAITEYKKAADIYRKNGRESSAARLESRYIRRFEQMIDARNRALEYRKQELDTKEK
jgi:hypothetical protein